MNIPADSSSLKLFTRVFGNALVITGLKFSVGSWVIPLAAQVFSRYKYGLKRFEIVSLDNQLAIPVYKTQVGSALILTLCSELFAPIIAVFLVDEACLRGDVARPLLLDQLMSHSLGFRELTE